MDKKPYIAPKVINVLPELDDIMIGVGEGSAIEVLTNDSHLDFEEVDYLENPGSSFYKDHDRVWDSF